MKFLYDKKNNRVVMYYEGENEFDSAIFSEIELELTEEELINLQSNIPSYIEDDKIIFKPTTEQQKVAAKEELKNKIKQAKSLDELKDLMLEIL